MEKISLKPCFREIIHKAAEPGVYFDALTHTGNTNLERGLGSIFVLSHLTQKNEDLSYLVSLVSSLAKREFYSPQSVALQDPKAAFERTLKKLNDVLDDFFKNNDFTINLGLAAIAGEHIFISRLGKFKVALARGNEYIDILNNVDLFSKNDGKEQKFANIISGKLLPKDKLFAYFPLRPITSREKVLNPIFIHKDQDEFCQKLNQLAENADNFSCCGVHIEIQQIKEIPVEINSETEMPRYASVYTAGKPVVPSSPSVSVPPASAPALIVQTRPDGSAQKVIDNEDNASTPALEKPNIIRSEVSVTRRENVFTLVFARIRGFLNPGTRRWGSAGLPASRSKPLRSFIVAAILIIAIVSALTFIRGRATSENTAIYNRAAENLKIARSQLSQNDSRLARATLLEALTQIGNISEKNIDSVRNDISRTLDIIDKVSSKLPELFAKKGDGIGIISGLTVQDNKVFAIDTAGKLYSVNDGKFSEIGQFRSNSNFIQNESSLVVGYDEIAAVDIYDTKAGKFNAPLTLKNESQSISASLYEGNLYTVTQASIFKYADVVGGQTKQTTWGNIESGDILSLAVDGNVYILTKDGKLTKYFKGKKESDYTFSVEPSAGSELFTGKDSSLIYLADAAKFRVYAFSKASGSLEASYKLENIGKITDISVTADGSIWIASSDSIWKILP